MNKRELAKIAKTLVQELPDLAASNDLLLRTPLGPILRALCLERSGWDPRGFYVWVFFQPLCIPHAHVFLSRLAPGRRHTHLELRHPRRHHSTAWSDPPGRASLPGPNPVAARCRAAGETAGTGRFHLPKVHRIRLRERWRQSPSAPRARSSSRGRFPEPVAERDPEAKKLRELLLQDPAAAQHQLQTWEEQTTRTLGLDQFRW